MAAPAPETIVLLRDLASVLDGSGVRWYVFGAQAVALHGVPRLTADVDVTASVDLGAVTSLVGAMRAAGFALRVPDVEAFAARTRVLPFVHDPTRLPLDLIVAGSGLEARFLERARPHDLGGVIVPVIAPEDLVVAKVIAGRPKDIEDVRGLLGAQPALDLAQITSLLEQIEEALGESGLVRTLEDLAREARPRARPRAPSKRRKRR